MKPPVSEQVREHHAFSDETAARISLVPAGVDMDSILLGRRGRVVKKVEITELEGHHVVVLRVRDAVKQLANGSAVLVFGVRHADLEGEVRLQHRIVT